jgi:hypothetical protein
MGRSRSGAPQGEFAAHTKRIAKRSPAVRPRGSTRSSGEALLPSRGAAVRVNKQNRKACCLVPGLRFNATSTFDIQETFIGASASSGFVRNAVPLNSCDETAKMATPENSSAIETCPYCHFRREIVAMKFSLFRPATALFVCPSCGSASAEPNGFKNKRRGRLRLLSISYLLFRQSAQPDAPISATNDEATVDAIRNRARLNRRDRTGPIWESLRIRP